MSPGVTAAFLAGRMWPPLAVPPHSSLIQETVDQAPRSGPLPPYDELVALEQALLVIVAGLWAAVDEAERRAPDVPGREWLRSGLTAIRYQTAVGLGSGPVSAHIQVRAPARACRWLQDRHNILVDGAS
ncbi:DUF6415 family natural product biosynthesis protein [Streptomyces sp. NPDC054765]